MIKLSFPIAPVAKERPRFTKTGHTYTPKKTVQFERQIRTLAQHQMWQYKRQPFSDAVTVSLHFFIKPPKNKKSNREYPTTRPDIDNLIKSILDALNGILWDDDSRICKITAEKKYSLSPVIHVTAQQLEIIE